MILGKDAFQVSDNNHCGLDQIMFISEVKDGLLMCFTFLKLFFSCLNLQSIHDVKGKMHLCLKLI